MKNILLIGGTGVLSTAVTKEAIKQGFFITMINRGHKKEFIPKGVELIISDKTNTSYIKKQLEGRKFEAIIDFLCYNKKELEASFNLYSKYTEQYFFISSAAVYNNSIAGPCDEGHPKEQPLWSYSINKCRCEELLVELSSKTKTNYTIVRPMITYDNTRIPYGIVPFYGYHWTLVERIKNNKPIIIWNNGENRCNMLRVEDFAIGLVGLIGNEKAFNESFNICGDETPSFNEILTILGELVGHKVTTINIDPNFYADNYPERSEELLGGRSITTIIDNSKIKRVVPEFNQNISIKDGIKMTIESYRNNNYYKGIDWKFDAITDRTVSKWCKKNHISRKSIKTSFIDYLGTAKLADRIDYFMAFYGNSIIIKKCKQFDLFMRQKAYSLIKRRNIK